VSVTRDRQDDSIFVMPAKIAIRRMVCATRATSDTLHVIFNNSRLLSEGGSADKYSKQNDD